MKIILSRKGFDSASGGGPSPLLVEEQRLISLPIPDTCAKAITYKDIYYDKDKSLYDLMLSLGIRVNPDDYAHLDPDINVLSKKEREKDWRGIFGQCESAQGHLYNNTNIKDYLRSKSKEDDSILFLFFGWFRDVKKTEKGYEFVNGTDKHVIWGYLEVGSAEAIKKGERYDDWKTAHPHYQYRDWNSNTAYFATDKLSFNKALPGCGVFNYNNKLLLTEPNSNNRSIWRLPSCFHPDNGTTMTYHTSRDRWSYLDKDYVTLKTVGRGQEFIVSENEGVSEWAKKLFE